MDYSHHRLGALRRADHVTGFPTLRSQAIYTAQAPASLPRKNVDPKPTMGANDTVGDCVPTGMANVILAQAALGGFTIDVQVSKVLQFYGLVTGYTPSNPATDQGTNPEDAFAFQALHGYDVGAPDTYSGLWADIEPDNFNLQRLAMADIGTCPFTLNMAMADQTVPPSGVWDTDTPASYGDPTPGSWGGHFAVGFSYTGTEDTDLVDIITWKMRQPATWRWVKSRAVNAYAFWHRQLDYAGRNFAGIREQDIAAQMAAFQTGT